MRKLRDTPPPEIPAWIETGRRRRVNHRRRVVTLLGALVLCSILIGVTGGRGVGAYAAAAVAVVLLAAAFASGA